ncbi:MAG: nitroreductase family protein [Bacillota bacterium]|nr:nitroreductase family protein [Bacillota bacterium]
MQFYDVIKGRTSIKRFKSTQISEDKLNRMITAAMMSPSWKNQTSYKFIIVDDAKKKEALGNTVINQTNEAGDAIKQAPIVAIITADPNASGDIADREYYMVDSAIAMEHFILAATEEGYGTCWIASIDEDKIRNILGIPSNFRVIAMTPIGEPAEVKAHNPEKNIKDYVFLNEWSKSYSDAKHKVMS